MPRSIRFGVLLLALALPLAAACAPTKKSAPHDLYGRVNDIRAQHGLGPLFACGPLVAAADAHARDMAATGNVAHRGSDGSSEVQRALRYGYGNPFVGENLAAGQTSVDELLAVWMSSGAHQTNLLLPDYQHVGFGYANGYWVGVFAAGGRC